MGALFTRARDVQTQGCQVRERMARFTPRTTEREMRSAWWDIKESEYLGE